MPRTKILYATYAGTEMQIISNKDEVLTALKKRVEYARESFSDNYDRFNRYRNMLYNTSMDGEMINALNLTMKPAIEFPILEPYVSRLLGEFSKSEPSFVVRRREESKTVDKQLLVFLDGHLQVITEECSKNNTFLETYKESLTGGFSAFKIHTDYINSMSFSQKIIVSKVYDPTMMAFDPAARMPHKGDGDYCYSLHPCLKEKFIDMYGNKYKQLDLTPIFGNFNLNLEYLDSNKEVVLLCEYFEKKRKRKKIVQLVTGQVMTMSDYEKLEGYWNQNIYEMAPFPEIKGKPRYTEIESIRRYVMINDRILEEVETDYKFLPIIFIDGNSAFLSNDGSSGLNYQRTRPFVYNCEGIQKLKNFAGATLANELENIDQNKYRVAIESVPESEIGNYRDFQTPKNLFYNAFLNGDKTAPLPAPEPLPRVSAPPELAATFSDCDRMMQVTLGSYDAAMGVTNNQISGRAIVEGAMTSNMTAMPYVTNWLVSLQRVYTVVLDLIPKYYKESRELPIISPKGDRDFVKVNSEQGPKLDYNSEELEVVVEPGVDFEVQRARSFDKVVQLATAFPTFRKFIETTPEGLSFLLDNLDVRKVDQLKDGVIEFTEQEKQLAQQAQQMAQQQTQAAMLPLQIKREQLQFDKEKEKSRNAIEAAKLNVAQSEADTSRLEALARVGIQEDGHELARQKQHSDESSMAIEHLTNLVGLQGD